MDFDIYRKCFRITLCALLMLIINAQKNAIYAGGLSYNDCVFSWEFGEVNRTPIIVRPVGKICYDRCQAECLAFARAKNGEDITDPDSYAANNEIQDDLNKDIIEQCIVLCQKGEIFKSKFREYDSSIKDKIQFRWSDKIAEIKAACNPASGSVGSAEYHYYSANLKIKVGDKIRITLINPTSSMENAVYLCGFKTVRMDTEDHRGSLDADLWGNHSWWKPYMNQSAYNDFVSYGVNHPRRWSARNKYENYTDIGIKIYDGDSLSIQYRGNFISNINSAGGLDNSLSMIMLKDFLGISIPKVYALPGSGFNNSDINFSSDKPNDYPSDVNPSYGQAQKVFLGLQGKVTYSSRDFNGYIFEGIKRQVADPNDQSKERYPMYNFWGVIEGLNKEFANPTSLFMSHGSASSNRDSAVGGFDTRITWRGCRYTHEDEVLEYAIVPKSKVGDETIYNPAQDPNIWEKVDITNLKEGKEFEPKMQGNEGILYLRINKVADHGGGDGREVERYNTSGGIFVFAEKSEKKNPVSGIISNVVKKVDDLLYKFEGYDSSNGVIKKVYKRFIEDGGIISAVRALLVLYIGYYGMLFMLGMAQMTQKEFLAILFKISLVLILISDKSFDFFSEYIFDFAKNGSIELIGKMISPMYTVSYTEEEIMQNPYLIFSVFDAPFSHLFSSAVWIKITALIFSGLLGFIFAIIVIISAVSYVICITKSVMIYIVSLIGMGIMFLIAPIFIPMILFKYTKTFFDSWLKQILSFTLQPIFVFTAVAFLNTLLLAGLYTTLGFTACKVCWLGFYLPGIVDICIVPGFITLSSSHAPPDNFVGSPISSLSALFFFLIIAQSMHVFVDFCSSIATTIATGSFVGLDVAGIASKSNIFTNIGGFTTRFLGLDSAARDERAKRMNAHYSSQAKNLSKKELQYESKLGDLKRTLGIDDGAKSSVNEKQSSEDKDDNKDNGKNNTDNKAHEINRGASDAQHQTETSKKESVDKSSDEGDLEDNKNEGNITNNANDAFESEQKDATEDSLTQNTNAMPLEIDPKDNLDITQQRGDVKSFEISNTKVQSQDSQDNDLTQSSQEGGTVQREHTIQSIAEIIKKDDSTK